MNNPQDADDVVQIVFLKAIKNIHSFQHKSGYFTWLYRIAVNECLNYLKKQKNGLEEYNDTICIHSGTEFTRAERNLLWYRLLHGFNKSERMLILLHVHEGIPITEIAEIMEISRQTIHRKWSRIKKQLQKCAGVLDE